MKVLGKALSRRSAVLAAALAMLGAVATAQAGPFVNKWAFTVDAAFDPTATVFSAGSGNPLVSNLGTNTNGMVSWGDSSGPLDPSSNLGRSGLKLGNDPSGGGFNNPPLITTNDLAGANTLSVTHVNHSISGAFATLLSTEIDSSLTLWSSDPANGTPAVPATTVSFSIKFTETPNATPCAVGSSPTPCNDIFVLTSGLLNFPFVYDGNNYFLNILNVTGGGLAALTPLPNNVCAAAGAPNNCLGFTTVEGTENTVQFGLVITGQPLAVPAPAPLALMGLGLLGLAGLRRRANRAAA